MPRFKKSFSLLIIFAFLFSFVSPSWTKAVVTDCLATISPNQVASGSTNNFTLNVNNTSANDIIWIKIVRPSGNFTLGNINASGWTKTLSAESITLTNGSLSSGSNRNFILTSVVAANINAPSADWTIQVSDDPSGNNPFNCTGSLGTQIGNPDVTAPVISGIGVSNITTNSVLISWTTDEAATSKVNFGTSQSYNANNSDSTLTTNHAISLTALTSASAYHFQVESADASSNTATSSDNTFVTQTQSSTQTSNGGTTNKSKSQTNKNQNSADQEAPVVSLLTDFSKNYKETPLIRGSATDNQAITSLEYTIDGGLNWLPVSEVPGLNQKSSGFQFRPTLPLDDNYQIIVRAVDSSGNVGQSEIETLIIDRLLPEIGPEIISVGPEMIQAQSSFTAVKGIDEKISLSAIGGPISISIKASAKKGIEQVFSLTRIVDSGLWSGVLAFNKTGQYSLELEARDGAGNKAKRLMNTITVKDSSRVVKLDGGVIKNAKVTLYSFDQETGNWLVWDGAAYGQKNPQTTNSSGEFSYFLPSGRYYLAATMPGFSDFTSKIFETDSSLPLSTIIKLKPTIAFTIGSFTLQLPSFSSEEITLGNDTSSETNDLVGENLPDFVLPKTSGGELKSIDLNSKPSVLVFITTWAPNTEDQLSQVEKLSENTDFNIVVVDLLESKQKVDSYRKIAGYKFEILIDEAGWLQKQLKVHNLPTQVFLSKSGRIKKISAGVLTKEELIYNLAN